MQLFIKRKSELKNLEYLSLCRLQKMRKRIQKRTLSVAKQPFDKTFNMGANQELNQPLQQKNSQFELKGKEIERNKNEKKIDGWDHKAVWL